MFQLRGIEKKLIKQICESFSDLNALRGNDEDDRENKDNFPEINTATRRRVEHNNEYMNYTTRHNFSLSFRDV